MTTVKYSLDQFVSDMEGLISGKPDQQKLFDTGSSWLEKLIQDPNALPEQYRSPVRKGSGPTTAPTPCIRGTAGCW